METNEKQNQQEENTTVVMGDYNDGVLYGIRICNAEFQSILQQIHKELTDLRNIRKREVERVLTEYASIELGEDINPFLEEESK